MSVYVGIDVHRKRSQVAVIDQDGQVLANRNVNERRDADPVGDRRPAAGHARRRSRPRSAGGGWPELLEDYGFEPHLVHPLQCKAIASARLKNDKVDAAILAQLLRADLLPEAWIAPPAVRQLRALLRHRAQLVRLRTLLQQPDPRGPGRPRPRPASRLLERAGPRTGSPRWTCPPSRAEVIDDALALIDALAVGHRPARLRGPPARQVRPAGQGPDPAARRRPVHRAGPAGRDRRHHPVRLGAQAGVLGRAHPDRPRLATAPSGTGTSPSRARSGCGGSCARPRRPPSAHRSSPPATRHRPAPRQEDRHHRDRPQAADPRLAPAHRRCSHRAGRRRSGREAGRVASPG